MIPPRGRITYVEEGVDLLGATPDPAAVIAALPGAPAFLAYFKSQVQTAAVSAVRPYVIGAYAVGGAGFLLGLTALIVSIARK